MPNYTKKIGLFKWNTKEEEDLNSQFNLEKSMNENLDKIDEALTEIDEKTLDDERVKLKHLNNNVVGNQYHLTKNGTYPNIYFKLASPLLAKEIHSVRWKFKIKRLGDSVAAGFYSPYGNNGWSLNISFTEPAINYNQTKLNEIVELETQNTSFSSTSTQKVEFVALGFNQNTTKNYEHIVYDVELYINDVRQDISLSEISHNSCVVDESKSLESFLASKKYVEEKKNEAIEHTNNEIARIENKTTFIENIGESSFGNLYRLQNPVQWGGNIAFKLKEAIEIDKSISHKVRVKVKVKDCGERTFNATSLSISFRRTTNSDYGYSYGSISIGNASITTMPVKEKFYEFENEIEEWKFSNGGITDSFVLTARNFYVCR